MSTLAIDARDIRVAYGATAALRGVTVQVPRGARVALLGANGAGKSTFLRVLSGATRPEGGSLCLGGVDALRGGAWVRQHIGVVAHQTFLYDELTASENLEFFASLHNVGSPRARAVHLLTVFGLAAKADTRARGLSRGQQQRLSLARALLHDPKILVLDEPDTGLDIAAFDMLGDLLLSQRTMVLATHDLALAARMCDRYVVLAAGRVAATGPMPSPLELEVVVRTRSTGGSRGAA